MGVTLVNKFVGTNATVVTPANSGSGGDAFTTANPGTPTGFTYSTDLTNPITGGTVAKINVGAGVVAENRWTVTDTNAVATQFVIRWTASPTTASDDIHQIRGTVQNAGMRLHTGGTLRPLNLGSEITTPSTPNWTIVTGTWYVVDVLVEEGTTSSNGRIRYKVRTYADLTTTVFSYDTGAIKNAGVIGTDVINSIRWGKITSTAVQPDVYLAQVGVTTDATGYMIDPGVNVAPNADITASKTAAVEPGETITLTITDSDSDGTVTTRTVRQISGTTVSISGSGGSGSTRTFTAPYTLSGTTLQFGYKVTDDDGTDSTEDTVNVVVLAATERIVTVGGATPTEVPLMVSIV